MINFFIMLLNDRREKDMSVQKPKLPKLPKTHFILNTRFFTMLAGETNTEYDYAKVKRCTTYPPPPPIRTLPSPYPPKPFTNPS